MYRKLCSRTSRFQADMDTEVGEVLPCKRESGNNKDPYAVAVMQRGTVVGHVLWKISTACSLFLCRNGTIHCTITGTRCFSGDLPQGGLEVPCELNLRGSQMTWPK